MYFKPFNPFKTPPLPCRMIMLALALSLAGQAAIAAPPPAKKTPAVKKAPAAKPAAKKTPAAPQAAPPAGGQPAVVPPKPSVVASQAPAVPLTPQPPDGKWLVDAEGRQYFLGNAPRIEGSYMWMNDEHTKVRLPYGLTFDVASYDDKAFKVKIYKADDAPVKAAGQMAPEELDKIAASYRTDLKTTHRVSFQPFDNGLPTRGQWRHRFAVADMNGDGHLDIVHGPARKSGSRPMIFLGDGKGSWRAWSEATYPPVAFDYGAAAVGDLNGDGHMDLVIASHLRGVTAMLGDGKGHFTLWSKGIDFAAEGDVAPPFSSRAVEVLDWNGDGRPDIVLAGEGPRLAIGPRGDSSNEAFNQGSRGLRVYINQGDGTWTKIVEEGTAAFGDDLAVADLNGDKAPDFAMAASILGYRAILGLSQPDGTRQRVNLAEIRPSSIVNSVATGDFDGDKSTDLAIAYVSNEGRIWRSGIDLLLARPGGTWERRTLANAETQDGVYGLTTGDLDGDGVPDLVGMTGNGALWIFLGDGKGGFLREQGAPAGEAGCRGYFARLADLDGDGKNELIVEYAGEDTASGKLGGGEPTCPTGGSLHAWKIKKTAGR
jgi:hypothetical protein